MKVTEVRIFPKEGGDKKLLAFATVTFDDCFVVRDLKIIEGSKGTFVAMPSRRIKQSCTHCGHRNIVRSQFCGQCGEKLAYGQEQAAIPQDMDEAKERQNEHKDIAHPITASFREYIQKTVLETFRSEEGKKKK